MNEELDRIFYKKEHTILLTDDINYNCVVTTEDGKQIKLYANSLHNNQLDQWKGWTCEAGATRLYINKDLEVYSGECLNDHLGSVDNFNVLPNTTCKQDFCGGCTDDLIVTKYESKF